MIHDAEQPAGPSRVKPFNNLLRMELAAFKEAKQYTMEELAKQLDASTTAVSKYLSGKPEGDVPKLEHKIDDVMRNDLKRVEARAHVRECHVSRKVNAFFETVRKRNQVGLLYGDAGLGKTCGSRLYCAENATSVLFTAKKFHANPQQVVNLLWGELKPEQKKWTATRMEFITEKLHGSNRLLVIDNCHKLTRSALDVFFDLHDETEVPIALVGNKEVLEKIRMSEQNYSRIGYVKELKLEHPKKQEESDAAELTAIVLEQYAPEAREELFPLALQVMEKAGHARALRLQLQLAADIKEKAPRLPWAEAFKGAHTRLIRNYDLTD